MSYDIGTHIDLSYLNRKSSGGSTTASKSAERLVTVGTQYMLRLIEGRMVAALRIPVAAM